LGRDEIINDLPDLEVKPQPKPKIKFPHEIPKNIKGKVCVMCFANTATSRHHLIPKSVWNGEKIKTIPVCKRCHLLIHKIFTNGRLKREYNISKSLRNALARKQTL
jgi:hypothetical protein